MSVSGYNQRDLLSHSQLREILDRYYGGRGIKRWWRGCVDCEREYCKLDNIT